MYFIIKKWACYLFFFSILLFSSCKQRSRDDQQNSRQDTIKSHNNNNEADSCSPEKKQDLLLAKFDNDNIEFIETKDCIDRALGLNPFSNLWSRVQNRIASYKGKTVNVPQSRVRTTEIKPVQPNLRAAEIRANPGKKENYKFENNEGARSQINSVLDEEGNISFVVVAQPGSKFRGAELFEQMMEHHGSEVKGIKVMWEGGTNWDKFKTQIDSGVKPKDAAMNTWTGIQARSFGFNKVQVIQIDAGSAQFRFY